MNSEQMMTKAIEEKDVKFLVKYFYDEDVSPLQEILIRKIAFCEHRKLSVCAMTRWGKSYCVSRGIGLFILMNKNRKIFFLAPTSTQSFILKDYLSFLVYKCQSLKEIAHLERGGEEKTMKHASRSRQTFSNGCEYRVFTTHGTAEGLMGFGLGKDGGVLVLDESCLIDEEARAKINRMLGDCPEKSFIIELMNPWSRDNKSFDHYVSDEWESFHVGWEQAIEDGRTTLEFISEQKKELTDLEFEVLYESKFPSQSEDSIFNLDKINEAVKKFENLTSEDPSLDDMNGINGNIIISCDVSDKGVDVSSWYIGEYINPGTNHAPPTPFRVYEIFSEDMSENMELAGKLMNLLIKYYDPRKEFVINIDCIGVGTGVVSRVREEVERKGWDVNVQVVGCHFGEKPLIQPERFSNSKAMNYFRLKELMEEGLILFPNHSKLKKELISMKWGFTGASKIKIIDPIKSPDFADCLCYFSWYSLPPYKPYIA